MQEYLPYFQHSFDLFSSSFFIISNSKNNDELICEFANLAFNNEFISSGIYYSPIEIAEVIFSKIKIQSIPLNRKFNLVVRLKSKSEEDTFYRVSIVSSKESYYSIFLEQIARFNDPNWNSILLNNAAIVYSTKPYGDYAFNFISDNVEQILGYKSTDFVKSSDFWDSLIDPDYIGLVINSLRNLDSSGEIRMVYPIANASGEYRWFEERAKLIRNSDGAPVEIIGLVIDVNEQKKSYDNLNSTLEELKTIINTIPGIIMVFNKDMMLLDANKTSRNSIDYLKVNGMVHCHIDEILGDNCSVLKTEILNSILNQHEISRITSAEEQTFFGNNFKILVKPIISRSGNVWGAVLVMFDIDSFVSKENELKMLIQSLEESQEREHKHINKIEALVEELEESHQILIDLNYQKDRFFSIIAHDLRTPLKGFMQLTQILESEYKDLSQEDIADLTGSMFESSQSLYKLLENLLEWSKIQLGKITYSPITMQLSTLVMMNIDLLQVSAKQKGIKLVNQVKSNFLVYTDVNIINTIIRNLITNAIKFSYPDSEVAIIANFIDNNYVEVGVKDNGVGMTNEVIETLFKLDHHITSKGTNNETGTGLGLVLCKELVQMNLGQIRCESKLGSGSCFYFTVPARNNNDI